MSGDQEKTPDNGAEAESQKDKTNLSDSIFIPDETIALVKGFLMAWIAGTLKIDLPNETEIIQRAKLEGKTITYVEASAEATNLMAAIEKGAAICLGTVASTPEQRQAAIDNLAQLIIRLRATHRLDGTFMDVSVENKIAELRRELDATNNLLRRFVDYFRSGGSSP